jgi:purine-cytosine permease-like protein
MLKFGTPASPHVNHDQNFYHLSCIQSVSIGPSAVIIGKQLSVQYGAPVAIGSILIGNLILWLIGLAIISMVYQARTNAIENIKGYIGQYGGLLFALILLFAFIDWYVIEINTTIKSLDTLFQSSYPWRSDWIIRIGAALGILASLLAIGGIRLLKWLTSFGFPLMLCYCIYTIISSD